MPALAEFFNCSLCIHGELVKQSFFIDLDSGLIVDKPDDTSKHEIEKFDLAGHIIAPAYIELQTNGCKGFHFTHFTSSEEYQTKLRVAAKYLLSTGVGSFYATVPTVQSSVFKQVLPELAPKSFAHGAELLGAHCEGPWLNPAKKGAHDSSLMQLPHNTTPTSVYGSLTSIKLITLAPELPSTMDLIGQLIWHPTHPIIVSLGHSTADYGCGTFAMTIGASCLTHVLNAMPPLNHRDPGLIGTITSKHNPYYSLIADGIHLHPATVALAFRANPARCILVTDSIELAGLPDGVYPGHAQVPLPQLKKGNKVVIQGTDTLVGSCIGLDECVRNLVRFSRCNLAQAVRCATENVVGLMGVKDRGVLEVGRRADFVVLDREGGVMEVWQGGRCVWNAVQERAEGGAREGSSDVDGSEGKRRAVWSYLDQIQ